MQEKFNSVESLSIFVDSKIYHTIHFTQQATKTLTLYNF